MTERASANTLLRRMTVAGYGAAAVAGAVTVGLIAGVTKDATATTATKNGSATNSSVSQGESDDGGSGSSTTNNTGGTSGVGSVGANNGTVVGGSHGS